MCLLTSSIVFLCAVYLHGILIQTPQYRFSLKLLTQVSCHHGRSGAYMPTKIQPNYHNFSRLAVSQIDPATAPFMCYLAFSANKMIRNPRATVTEASTSEPMSQAPLSDEEKMLANYVPIYVMLQLGVISNDSVLEDVAGLGKQIKEVLSGGVKDTCVQVLSGGWTENIEVAGENALPSYDRTAYNQILLNVRPNGINSSGASKLKMAALAYLRLTYDLIQRKNFKIFKIFVKKLHAEQSYCSDPRKYGKLDPLERSKAKVPFEDLLKASEPIKPFPFDEETDMSVGGVFADYWDILAENHFYI